MRMAMKKEEKTFFSPLLKFKSERTRENEKRLIQVVVGMIENYSNDFLLFFNTINVHGLIKQFGFHDCVCLSHFIFSFSSSQFSSA